jgi:hypothetical protein
MVGESVKSLESNLDNLVNNCSSFSKSDKECVQSLVERVVGWYGNSRRKFETDDDGNLLFSYEHSVNVANLMLDYYFSGKDRKFNRFFDSHCVEHLYVALLHDVVEDRKVGLKELYFYLKTDKHISDDFREKIIHDVTVLTKSFNAASLRYATFMSAYLSRVKSDEVTANVKCFDILSNSLSINSGHSVDDLDQFDKLRGIYHEFIKDVLPRLCGLVMKNVYAKLNSTQLTHIFSETFVDGSKSDYTDRNYLNLPFSRKAFK